MSDVGTLTWRDEGETEGGVTERGFIVKGERDEITGVTWSPPELAASSPLVLRLFPANVLPWPSRSAPPMRP